MKHLTSHLWISLVLSLSSFASSTIVYEPSLYFSERDSPFYGGIVDNAGEGIYLEDFEDQQLNTPFVKAGDEAGSIGSTFRARFSSPGATAIWGVDGDDGIIDGQGLNGDVWISTSRVSGSPAHTMSFEFEPNEDGNYPLYVGFVITRPNSFFSGIEVCWDDPDGTTIHDEIYRPREWAPPEGVIPGSPLNQRFVGIYHSEGIGSVLMENVNQLDHLQYGYSIPEPSSTMLSLLALSLSLGLRKRR